MKVGDIAPNFILKDEKGNDFELYANLDKQVLLVFYPKDDTLVCSAQLQNYNNDLSDFNKRGIKIIGISTDSVESHFLFCNKLKLNFTLLADVDKKVSKAFDAINFLGSSKRLLVLIDTDKKVIWIDSTLSITFIKSAEILKNIELLHRKELT
jgi:peroxiredoxin